MRLMIQDQPSVAVPAAFFNPIFSLMEFQMSKSVAFKAGQSPFSPAFQDMIDRRVDLMKLDIVQGLAYEQEPSLMAARGVSANPSRLAPIVAARLRNAKPGGKRGQSNALKALPLT
jgi:hypothetical protein